MGRDEEFAEIFVTPSLIEADYLRLYLEDHEIPCFVRDLRITPYPVHVKNMSEQQLYVPRSMVEKAKALILQVMEDQGISLEGSLSEEESPDDSSGNP
jgi:hypothetical protein